MNLDDAQKQRVAVWVAEGLKLSEIQNRIVSEFGLRLTYMDVRFLVDDLKLTPKDTEPPKAPAPTLKADAPPKVAGKTSSPHTPAGAAEPATASGHVSVSVDQIARPGAVVSGKVVFSDGKEAEWYFDQAGRLGLNPGQPGYRPTTADLQQFQTALESELSRLGF